MVVIQSDLLDELATRVVAPLLLRGAGGRGLRSLNPEVAIGDQTVVLMPQLLATLTVGELGERVGSLTHSSDKIVRALDALLSGI